MNVCAGCVEEWNSEMSEREIFQTGRSIETTNKTMEWSMESIEWKDILTTFSSMFMKWIVNEIDSISL